MTDDNRDRLPRLPKVNLNSKTLIKHAKRVESATTKHAHKFIIKRWSNVREVRRHVVSWVIAMSLLIAATGLQLMWFQQSYRTSAQSTDGTYAEAVLGSIETLNPIYASTSAEQAASYLMFSRLMRYDKTGNLNYDLASNVVSNGAGNEFTVTIRPDAKWHDGEKLTAKDIDFTFNLLKNDSVHAVISGWDGVSIQVIDNYTVKFTTQNTYAAFKHTLTFPIVPEHILGKVSVSEIRENRFSQNPVGSGPFKMNFIQDVDTNSGRKVIYLTRNENYYAGMAKLARFQLHTYTSGEDILSALSSNEVNAAADLSPVSINNVDKKRYDISANSIQSGVYAIINTKSQILNDISLRQALRLATDTTQVRKKLMPETKILDLPFTSGQLTGDVPVVPSFDKIASQKILNDNGWVLNAKGVMIKDNRELKISAVTIKGSEFESVLETLVGQWREVGFTVDTKVVDPADATQNVAQNILQPRNFDVFVYQLNIGADPDVYAYWHSSQTNIYGLNFSNYSNTISDDALSSARVRTEWNLRNAKYITFAKQWIADVPAIGLYQSTAQYVRSNKVHSFDVSNNLVSSIDRYSDVLDWSVGKRTVYKTP